MRAHERADAELRGFERVMSSSGDKAASDESDRGHRIEGGQLANGIQQQNRSRIEGTALPFGAALPSIAALFEQSGNGLEALCVTRREHHAQLRFGRHQSGPCLEQKTLFAFQGAAADQDLRIGWKGLTNFIDQGRICGGADIELEIAAELHPLRRYADCPQPRGIGFGLRQGERDTAENTPPEEPQPQIPGKRAVGDTGVDDCDVNSGAAALPQHARPELGLGQHEELGLQGAQVAAHGKGKIERIVEDILRTEAFAGDALTSEGGG